MNAQPPGDCAAIGVARQREARAKIAVHRIVVFIFFSIACATNGSSAQRSKPRTRFRWITITTTRARDVVEAPRGFRAALASGAAPRIVAELKRRSPSKGLIRPDFDPVACALAYAEGGAAALSVLTDAHFFGGELGFLERVRAAVALPLLRKDFLIDPYQVDEARVHGADAVQLIAAALAPAELARLGSYARSRGLDALECWSAAERVIELAHTPEAEGGLGLPTTDMIPLKKGGRTYRAYGRSRQDGPEKMIEPTA